MWPLRDSVLKQSHVAAWLRPEAFTRLGPGEHTRKMLLCKVARGKVFKAVENMAMLKGATPAGFDSVHGDAQKGGALDFDELVVYRERNGAALRGRRIPLQEE